MRTLTLLKIFVYFRFKISCISISKSDHLFNSFREKLENQLLNSKLFHVFSEKLSNFSFNNGVKFSDNEMSISKSSPIKNQDEFSSAGKPEEKISESVRNIDEASSIIESSNVSTKTNFHSFTSDDDQGQQQKVS